MQECSISSGLAMEILNHQFLLLIRIILYNKWNPLAILNHSTEKWLYRRWHLAPGAEPGGILGQHGTWDWGISTYRQTGMIAQHIVGNTPCLHSSMKSEPNGLTEIHIFSFKKIHFKMSGKWRPFCLGLNVLKWAGTSWDDEWMGDTCSQHRFRVPYIQHHYNTA